jgi:hypothetical protein
MALQTDLTLSCAGDRNGVIAVESLELVETNRSLVSTCWNPTFQEQNRFFGGENVAYASIFCLGSPWET